MAFGPFGLLGVGARAAGVDVPGIGGVAGELLAKKKPAEIPPQGQNDPRVKRSTVDGGYGRGSSSLSV